MSLPDPSLTLPSDTDPDPDTDTAQCDGQAVISRKVKILGDISGQEDLLIYGTVEGNIEFRENNVIIGQGGKAHADISAKTILVEGEVKGELRGGEQVTIKPSGDVIGDIKAPRVILNDGCKFRGMIDMESKSHPQGELKKSPVDTQAKSLPTRTLGSLHPQTIPPRHKR